MLGNVLLCIAAFVGIGWLGRSAEARHHHHYHGSSSGWSSGGWSSGVYGTYGYGGSGPSLRWWGSGPLYVPADSLYGPSHIFGGVGAAVGPIAPAVVPQAPAPQAAAPINGFGVLAGGAAPAPGVPAVRASNRTSQQRAQQLVAIGDNYFRKQNYSSAFQRYKDAAASAPDVADSYFREGLALAALGRWELAAKALKRGLELDARWPSSNFRLVQIYGDNKLAKTAQWEALAKQATEKPNDPDPLFLLGVQLFFDGQRDRARAFFEQAKAIEHGPAKHLAPFLEQLAKPPTVPPGPRQI
ncbi:MAG TPA: hypothetical protein VG713_19110 [Pirellulales bacterium]|nr:hypothetical protein [Pirellulales bacterium]